MTDHYDEARAIRKRYHNRKKPELYSILRPEVLLSLQERERALSRWIKREGIHPISEMKVLEVGCGSGGNLLELIRFGFSPENLIGIDLIKERVDAARRVLPKSVQILTGDALDVSFEPESFDVVLLSTVFSSILDKAIQRKLANRIWSYVKPGGGILWYDFIYDNPKNPDVKGIPAKCLKHLFPQGEITLEKLTLAPPISRAVCIIHPSLYALLNCLSFLRTHILAWIRKPIAVEES